MSYACSSVSGAISQQVGARRDGKNGNKLENKNEGAIFPKGDKAPADHFTGTVYVQMLAQKTESNNYSIAGVTFEPGARSNWHTHPAGQTLIVINGKGLYQEKGKPIKTINKGDTVICDPDIEHWHGASSETRPEKQRDGK